MSDNVVTAPEEDRPCTLPDFIAGHTLRASELQRLRSYIVWLEGRVKRLEEIIVAAPYVRPVSLEFEPKFFPLPFGSIGTSFGRTFHVWAKMSDGRTLDVAKDPKCQVTFLDGDDPVLRINAGTEMSDATATPIRTGAGHLRVRYLGLEAEVVVQVFPDDEMCRDATPLYQDQREVRELSMDKRQGVYAASHFDVIVFDADVMNRERRARKIGNIHSQDPGFNVRPQRISGELLSRLQLPEKAAHGCFLFVRSPPSLSTNIAAKADGAKLQIGGSGCVGGHNGSTSSVEPVPVLWEGRASSVEFLGPAVVAIKGIFI